MSKHTKEPWKTVKPGHGQPTKYLCVQLGKDESYTTLELLPADARRIVACVNACAGMADPAAEIAALRECAEALKFILRGCENGSIKSKPIVDMSDETAEQWEPQSLASYIRAALAKLPKK